MLKRFLIPGLALLGVFIALIAMVVGAYRPPTPPITYPPPQPPYLHFVAGSGIIEASSENIDIGAAVIGITEKVFVEAGDIVKKGDPLFQVDTRRRKATLEEAQAAKEIAVASFNRLVNEPRAEELPPAEARVKQANIRYADESTQYNLFQNVSDKRAISFNEFNQRKYSAQLAKYELEQAKADLDLLKAGAWIEDIKIASREVERSERAVEVAEAEIQQTIARAPMDGMVMQVNIREGEWAAGGSEDSFIRDPLMIFGRIDPLHVRIDVDEDDAWRIYPGAPAMAYLRGNSEISFPLKFVRVEPFVIPKRSLTGENLERVDTRVLQLIYRFDKDSVPIYLGQLVDVYVESKPSRGL